MTSKKHPLITKQHDLEPNNAVSLAVLCGELDAHLKQIEQRLHVEIRNRGNQFQIQGDIKHVNLAENLIKHLYSEIEQGFQLTPEKLHLLLQESTGNFLESSISDNAMPIELIKTKHALVKSRGKNQLQYIQKIQSCDINFGIGPAGTGKTFLAVACAAQALERNIVERIILVRPAVEAGEKLGFLPGDLNQKVDPYLRPLYDGLYELLGVERVEKYIEKNIIEIAPLAYMRGRTLNNAYIILDESQNTTIEQMKMFLTRIGFGSTAVITGDITQIDLPKHIPSGLVDVINVLKNINGIHFTFFDSKDVVRHPLVQRIVEAYQHHEANRK